LSGGALVGLGMFYEVFRSDHSCCYGRNTPFLGTQSAGDGKVNGSPKDGTGSVKRPQCSTPYIQDNQCSAPTMLRHYTMALTLTNPVPVQLIDKIRNKTRQSS